jgi:cytochrome c-type biogenesis protein CcmE
VAVCTLVVATVQVMMPVARKRRLYQILMILLAVSLGLTLLVTTLRRHIELYQTPSELSMTNHRPMMLGGMVVKGSVQHPEALVVAFNVTDFQNSLPVRYKGVLPALFREGQGVVVKGHLDGQGVFVARQVLAKHDENYHPPGIKIHKEKHA